MKHTKRQLRSAISEVWDNAHRQVDWAMVHQVYENTDMALRLRSVEHLLVRDQVLRDTRGRGVDFE